MIFIGRDLSNPNAHFVTNIVQSIGDGDDLLIDLNKHADWSTIATLIEEHCLKNHERYAIYNPATDEDVALQFKRRFPHLTFIIFFSDDEWRQKNYDRYLALFSDVFTIAVKDHLTSYERTGLRNVFYMRWCCNPALFYPVANHKQTIDVSFIGAAYGQRVEMVRFLQRSGIAIRVFGPGWDRFDDVRPFWGGVLSHDAMLKTISASKINLNFLWTSRDEHRVTIKGRTLELVACRGFQLTNECPEFDNYGFVPDQTIATFSDRADLLKKIQFYLAHPDRRAIIAQAAYDHVVHHLTWKRTFSDLFSRIEQGNAPKPNIPYFRILVIATPHIRHAIQTDDPRMAVTIVPSRPASLEGFDGIIELRDHSTLNNDALWMMAFGLYADEADVVVANFRISGHWIRVTDKALAAHPGALRLLPVTCRMVRADYSPSHHGVSRIAMVEYPAFEIGVNYLQARLLRLWFADHGDSRSKVRRLLARHRYGRALAVLCDRLWQKWRLD